jgi:hypothetical protein
MSYKKLVLPLLVLGCLLSACNTANKSYEYRCEDKNGNVFRFRHNPDFTVYNVQYLSNTYKADWMKFIGFETSEELIFSRTNRGKRFASGDVGDVVKTFRVNRKSLRYTTELVWRMSGVNHKQEDLSLPGFCRKREFVEDGNQI